MEETIRKPQSKPKTKSVKIQTNCAFVLKHKQKSKRKQSQGSKVNSTNISQRSRRKIKKVKTEDSFISDIDAIEASSLLSVPSLSNEITFEGQLVYRFSCDQIEFLGEWASTADWNNKQSHQSFAYLLMKRDRILFTLSKHQIDFSHSTEMTQQQLSESKFLKGDQYSLSVSSGNLAELLLIPSASLLNHILLYLSGHYSGYFLSKSHTVEDSFFANFVYENSNTRLIGNGVNCFGEFQLTGVVAFIKTKENIIQLASSNKLNDFISLGDISMKRTYL